jgi:hypothetical protein
MDERELTYWLDALAEAGLIGDWQWDLAVGPGERLLAFNIGSTEGATTKTALSSWCGISRRLR